MYKSFLKWWLVFTLSVVGTIFAHYSGILREVWGKDASHLSFAIVVIYYVTSLICGIQLYSLCKYSGNGSCGKEIEAFEAKEQVGWFVSELCLNLGMLGTIIGFCMMLAGFDALDISKQHTIQGLLSELGKSMATALYTTLVGLICGQLLKIQYFIFSLELTSKSSYFAKEEE